MGVMGWMLRDSLDLAAHGPATRPTTACLRRPQRERVLPPVQRTSPEGPLKRGDAGAREEER